MKDSGSIWDLAGEGCGFLDHAFEFASEVLEMSVYPVEVLLGDVAVVEGFIQPTLGFHSLALGTIPLVDEGCFVSPPSPSFRNHSPNGTR